jgi:hypothetical protein
VIRHQLAILACTVLSTGVALATAIVPAEASSPPTGHWGSAHQVPGLGKLNTGHASTVVPVSCSAPGDCVAAGTYLDSTPATQSFLISEHAGTWGTPVPTPKPDPTSTDSSITAVSCSPHGGCVAVGSFDMPGSPGGGFIVTRQGGHWGGTMVISGTQILSTVSTVSCARDDNCVVGGFILDGPENGQAQPFIMDEVNGAWRSPQTPPGLSALNAVSGQIISASCTSPGNCAATGTYRESTLGPTQTFVVEESGGMWGPAQALPKSSTLKETSSFPAAVSCAAPGDCSVAGTYTTDPTRVLDQLFVASEVQGKWGSPQQIPGTGKLNKGKSGQSDGLSCAATGTCVAVGFITDSSGFRNAVVADEKNGTWQTAREPGVQPMSEAKSVSCVSASSCVVGGYSSFGDANEAFTINETSGTWGKPQLLPGIKALNQGGLVETANVDCTAPGNCSVGGIYIDANGSPQGFLDEESAATKASLKLSAAKIRFGHEQAETLSVTVKARTGGTPSGQVTILAGKTRICGIKLKAGKGTCKLKAEQLKAGTYQLTGDYGGSRTYSRSATAPKSLKVTK